MHTIPSGSGAIITPVGARYGYVPSSGYGPVDDSDFHIVKEITFQTYCEWLYNTKTASLELTHAAGSTGEIVTNANDCYRYAPIFEADDGSAFPPMPSMVYAGALLPHQPAGFIPESGTIINDAESVILSVFTRFIFYYSEDKFWCSAPTQTYQDHADFNITDAEITWEEGPNVGYTKIKLTAGSKYY